MLERTYRRRVPPQQAVTPELARHLASASHDLGREVGVLIGRDGIVRNVIVGNARGLMLPDIGRLRGGTGRFRGLRLLHTRLRGSALNHDDLNDLVLLRLDLVAVIEVLEGGWPGRLEAAYLDPGSLAGSGNGDSAAEPFLRIRARSVHDLDLDFQATIQALEREFARLARRTRGPKGAERVMVVGLRPEDAHFGETLELVRSAGATIAGRMRQRRPRIHPRTVLGKGKLEELVLESMRCNATAAIFDIDLKPAQARAFEDRTGLKAVDRTQLILDIFAQRARSADGKLQVELAQLKYSLPRLTEKDEGLSRLTGGIGGRGPGETVMEIGRRRIRTRIRRLEKRVEHLSRQRELRRRRRRRQGLPVLSIIGYTNAGKSTLLNALTNSVIEAEDKLFMTLDPTSRRLRFPREGEVLITDTVGFIAELPPDLISAFRATLEELSDANLLLHVIDAADPVMDDKIRAVEMLLVDLDLNRIPLVKVLNKIDLLPREQVNALCGRLGGLAVSATRREGLAKLVKTTEHRLAKPETPGLNPISEKSI